MEHDFIEVKLKILAGNTIEEAIANLKEATELYLEEMPLEEKQPRSLITTFEITIEPNVKAQENIR